MAYVISADPANNLFAVDVSPFFMCSTALVFASFCFLNEIICERCQCFDLHMCRICMFCNSHFNLILNVYLFLFARSCSLAGNGKPSNTMKSFILLSCRTSRYDSKMLCNLEQ